MRIDVYIHAVDDAANEKLDRILAAITELRKEQAIMSKELDAMKAEVENAVTVEESAIALIQGLATKIEELKDDPVALQGLADQLKAEDARLADAVTANTPAQ